MKNLLRNSLLLVFLILVAASQLFAEPADTVVVYEYVYVTDTVWIERDTFDFKKLMSIEPTALQVNNPLPFDFYPSKSATISENSIIKEETKKQSEMKRTGFFTLLLLSVQSLTFGQAEFSVNAGTSSMWLEHGVSTISNPMWTGAHVGAELSFPIKNSNWSIAFGTQGKYLTTPLSGYHQIKASSTSLTKLETQFVDVKTKVMLNELNTGLFTAPYWGIDVPVKIKYKLKTFEPFVGLEYNFSSFIYEIPSEFNNSFFSYKTWLMDKAFHEISLSVGTAYLLTNNWRLNIELANGLIGRHNYFQDYIYPTLGAEEYSLRSLNVDLSIVYVF